MLLCQISSFLEDLAGGGFMGPTYDHFIDIFNNYIDLKS